MPKLTILIGIPCSGKSTWAKEQLKANQNLIRVNRDEFRYMLRDDGNPGNRIEKIIDILQEQAILHALVRGFDVIVDNTNCKPKYLNALVDSFSEYADIEFKTFEISLVDAFQRNIARKTLTGVYIPEHVMVRMCNNFDMMVASLNLDPIKRKVENA